MKKRLLSALLALCMALALAPVTARAAESEPPDWYFLFAIFKNVDADYVTSGGAAKHTTYTMTRDEIYIAKKNAERFETYMNQVGVMRAHVDVMEIDRTVTELTKSDLGSYLSAAQAAPALTAAGVDLDQYDHVTCVVSLGVTTGYRGMGGTWYENGTGHACINLRNRERAEADFTSSTLGYPNSTFVHEFLHFMEHKSGTWGAEFDLHTILDQFNPSSRDDDKSCLTNIILNRVQGNAKSGTGVLPISWLYPPHVLRKISDLNLGTDVTGISDYALYGLGNLERVRIPASVTGIGYAAFWGTGLTDVYYEGAEAQWKRISVGAFNENLTNANIHYNSRISALPLVLAPSPAGAAIRAPEPTGTHPVFTDVPDWCLDAASWGAAAGITYGTGGATFSPNEKCTNAQIITFLWRALGEPAATITAPFTVDAYYQEAVNWAYGEWQIDDSFMPDMACSRLNAVTYIWQIFGSPYVTGDKFTDVSSRYASLPAVYWAVENGITYGTSDTTFSPGKTCTRGEIITFLYRAFA